MRFGGEIDHQPRAVDRPPSGFGIGDVAFDEVSVDPGQSPFVAGVGQTIQHTDPPLRAVASNGSHEIGADEPGAAGNEDRQSGVIDGAVFSQRGHACHRWGHRLSGSRAKFAFKRLLLSCSKPISDLSS